jgi:hypothetical protein
LASTGADATADVFEATISLTVPSNLKRRSSKRAVGVLGLAILEEEGQRLARAMPKIQCSEDAGTLLLGRGYRDGCCRLRPGRLVTFCWARLPRMPRAGRFKMGTSGGDRGAWATFAHLALRRRRCRAALRGLPLPSY